VKSTAFYIDAVILVFGTHVSALRRPRQRSSGARLQGPRLHPCQPPGAAACGNRGRPVTLRACAKRRIRTKRPAARPSWPTSRPGVP